MNENESEKVDSPQFLTIAQLMRKIPISRPTIYRYIKKGLIPTIRIGRRVIIDAEFLSRLKERASDPNKEKKE